MTEKRRILTKTCFRLMFVQKSSFSLLLNYKLIVFIKNMWTKEDILKETQRIAKEKGGSAPSEKELELNAGIKSYYWHKYWVKIADLQIEAGYSPNTFLKTPHKHDALCEKFIIFMRELKKWPSKAEIEVKHNKEKGFPGSSIFYKNLGNGNIEGLAKNILAYIKDQQGFDDVINICNSVIEKYKHLDNPKKGNAEKIKHGWVYLIRHGRYNHYRIGQTTNKLRRWKENKIELPEEPTLVHEIETVDPVGVETYWLNHFKLKKTSNKDGDWFNLNRDDVNEFKAWKRII